MLDILQALKYLKQKGLKHHNLKLGNIMFKRNGSSQIALTSLGSVTSFDDQLL